MATLHSIHPIEALVGARSSTVRRGIKWYNENDQNLELCYCHDGIHEIVGHGRSIIRALRTFNTLSDHELANEHEASSRTVAGLLEAMRRAYGEDFKKTELVTVLTYWRTD